MEIKYLGGTDMNIDITEIVKKRIDTLEAEGTIEKKIAETFENTIVKAVEDSLGSYKLRNAIEQKITEQVSKVAADLDFQSYNAFMIEKMSQIMNETCREDMCKKAEKRFRDLFLCQTKEIKLSSIFEKYGEIACKEVEEEEKFNSMDEGWHCKCEINEKYGWIDCEMDYDDRVHRYSSDSAISFAVHKIPFGSKGIIKRLYLDGHDINERFSFGRLNDVELMLVQAVMNEIPIIIDVEHTYDIDNSFDVN